MSGDNAIVVSPLAAADRDGWEALARGYKAFYRTAVTDAEYARAFERLVDGDGVYGLAARSGDALVGIAHYLFHTTIWAPTTCYLQDLFVAPNVRGRGAGRALIEAVVDAARNAGAVRCYWLTQEHNAVARALYDRVAQFNGFIRYEIAL